MAVYWFKNTIKLMSFHKTQFLGCYLTIFHTDRCFALGVHYFAQKEWFCFVPISLKDKTVTLHRTESSMKTVFRTNLFSKALFRWQSNKDKFFYVFEFVILTVWGERNRMCPLNNNEVLESNDILITASNVSARMLWVPAPVHKLTALL